MENNGYVVNRKNASREEFAQKMKFNPGTQQVRKKNGEKQTVPQKKPKERYTTKTKRIVEEQKRKARIRKIRNRIIALGVVGLVAFGGYNSYREYKDSKNTLTLSQALDNGETLESLGIDQEIAEKLEMLEKEVNGYLTNSELIDLAPKILNLQFDTAKSKLANAINVEESDITLRVEENGMSTSVGVNNEKTYEEENFINKMFGNTISSDISNYIHGIARMQGIRDTLVNGDINRDEVIECYKNALEETSKFAAGKVNIDSNGNIIFEKTRVSQIENKESENSKNNEGFEIGD